MEYRESNHTLPLGASLYTVFLCILFGANAVAIKISLTGIGIFTTAGLRFSLAATVLCLWATATGKPLAVTREQAIKLIPFLIIFPFQLSLYYFGLSKTTASHGTLIANLLPFVVLVLAHFFIPGDRITMRKITGLFFGFAGVVFLFFDKAVVNSDAMVGDLMVLCASFLWGCSAVYVKRIISGFHAVQITLYPMIFTAPLFLLLGYLFDGEMVRLINPAIIKAFLYQSIVTASFGFVAWNGMLQKFGATALHSFIFIMPLSGVFFGVLLLGEPVTIHLITSILSIVTGIMIIQMKPKRCSSSKAGLKLNMRGFKDKDSPRN